MSLAQIIAHYETAFAAINGTGAFTTTVREINAKPTNTLKGASASFPKLTITPESGSVAFATRTSDLVSAVVEVEGWVTGTPGASHVAALVALWEDVKRAIRTDPSCGGYAKKSQLAGFEFLWGESEAGFLQKIDVQFAEDRIIV